MQGFNWSPGIGDPTPMGWLTVVLYLVTAAAAWRVARRLRDTNGNFTSEALFWGTIAILFLALGINKQLDLQSALTEIGRVLARTQGWYPQRYVVQVAFVAVIGVASLSAAAVLLVLLRRAPAPAWLALAGTVLVMLFVTIRAASFHHIDRLIGTTVLGLRWNWILEIGGILIVLVATRRRA
jgi:hypothetical protein